MKFNLTNSISCLVFSWLIGTFSISAADKYFFWIAFKDKNNSPYSLNNPSAYLSERALVRRGNYWIQMDSTDLPVNPQYVTQVASNGVAVHARSKWLNGITITTTDTSKVALIRNLPFVKSAVYTGKNTVLLQTLPRKNKFSVETLNYGAANAQINQLQGQVLHDHKHTGKDIVIAVLDAGFKNVNINPAFDSLRLQNRLLGVKNFIDSQTDVYNGDVHGAYVLSVMTGNLPGQYLGTAPHASFWLLQTEYAPTEFMYEVDCWVSGAEFADSVGADIINSSLGYTEFDDPTMNYTYNDMNGNVSRASKAANLASQKGIIVCNSAGNSGNTSWKYIGAPADAQGILAVGSVTSAGIASTFSSYGPSSDNRIKPEVCATGSATALINTSGAVIYGNGTSFSCPVIAGLSACYLDFFKSQTSMFSPSYVRQSIMRSANLYYVPENQRGFGIPDFATAIYSIPTNLIINTEEENVRLIFIPGTKELLVNTLIPSVKNFIRIFSSEGKAIYNFTLTGGNGCINLDFLAKGIYLATLWSDSTKTSTIRIIVP